MYTFAKQQLMADKYLICIYFYMTKKKTVKKTTKKPIKARLKSKKKNKKPKKSGLFIFISVLAILLTAVYLFFNYSFSSLLKNRIDEIYAQSNFSEYYSLEYKKLKINPYNMSFHLYNAKFTPIKKANANYFKKNGSLDVKIGAIGFSGANIFEFLTDNNLDVNSVKLRKVKVIIQKNAKKFTPFAFVEKKEKNDSLELNVSIGRIVLKDASVSVNDYDNSENSTELENLDIEIMGLYLDKQIIEMDAKVESITTKLSKFHYSISKGVELNVEFVSNTFTSIRLHKDERNFDYSFENNEFIINKPLVYTADGLYKIEVASIKYSSIYDKLIIKDTKIKPLQNPKKIAKNSKYQIQVVDMDIPYIEVANIDIDKLKEDRAIIAEQILINDLKLKLFKDKGRPLNKNNFPDYIAQQIFDIKAKIDIKNIKVANSDISVKIIQETGKQSAISINNLTLNVSNVQNRNKNEHLKISVAGEIESTIPFTAKLDFNYRYNHFKYSGSINKSNIKGIAKAVASFAPVKIHNGNIQSMKFSGVANKTSSSGKMTFAYTDINLEIDRKVKGKNTKFTNHLLSVAANSIIKSNNPSAPDMPLRKVLYTVDRDMNKGFVNILIKSVLEGMKESFVPSKENKKLYRKARKR